MNFSKLRKKLSSAAAALLCAAMVLGISVSATENKTVWNEAVSLSGAPYNSNYIKWVKNNIFKTIKYEDSMTKKFFDKYTDVRNEGKPFSYSFTNDDTVLSITYNESNIKIVNLGKDKPYAVYVDTKEMTMLDIEAKEINSISLPDGYFTSFLNDVFDNMMLLDNMVFDSDYNKDGKYFKFKSGTKSYRYEEFKVDDIDLGFLFSEEGELLAIGDSTGAYCVNVSFSVDESDFDIPDGYKTVGYNDFKTFDSDLS